MSARPRSGGETVPQELREAMCSAAWLGLAITRLVKVFVLLKMQIAVQICPREWGHGDLHPQHASVLNFTETKTSNTTEDLGPVWFRKSC